MFLKLFFILLTFYIRQAGPFKRRDLEACDNLSPYSPSRQDWVRLFMH